MTVYGKDTIIKVYIISLIILVISFFTGIIIIKFLLLAISLFLLLFTSYFFRDPIRKLPKGTTDEDIISPADGKVVEIKTTANRYPEIFSDKELKQISIFMSPLNVHVNRFPITGEINYFNYIRGKYLVAFNEKSSEDNERTEIGISNGKSQIIFKQIAGFVARRIVCNIRKNDYAVSGEKFGMIKFGSRVDILFKTDTKILVNISDKVKAGLTVLAKFTT